MAYYTALITEWNTLSGTTDVKISLVNGAIIPGPNKDITIPSLVGYLLLSGAYLPLSAFSNTAQNGNITHDIALNAAKTLMAIITVPYTPTLQTSLPAVYTTISTLSASILANEIATPGSIGFTQAVHDGLLALAATTVPWWEANGYSGPISYGDLAAAGGLT